MAGILETYNKMLKEKNASNNAGNDFLSVYKRMTSAAPNDLSVTAAYRRMTGNEIVDDIQYGTFSDRINTFGKLLNQELDKYNSFESSFDENKYYSPSGLDNTNTSKLYDYANKFLIELEKNKSNYDESTYNALKNYLQGAASAASGMSDTTSKIRDYYSQFKDENEYNLYQKYQKTAKELGFSSINDMISRIGELKNTIESNLKNIQSKNVSDAEKAKLQENYKNSS
jgi:hypothetical protein